MTSIIDRVDGPRRGSCRRRLLAVLALWTGQLPLAASAAGQGLVLVSPEEYDQIPVVSPPLAFAELPGRSDMSEYLPRPRSQGSQGSCVAWAVAYGLKTYQESAELGRPPTGPDQVFSPAYIYNQLVANRPNADCDAGTSIPAALNILKNQGAATLAEFPYDPSSCRRLPTLETHADASVRKIADWGRVDLDQYSMKAQLAAGTPVVISMCVGPDFHRHGSGVFHGDRGEAIIRDANNHPRCADGGHAMLVTGYDDDLGAYRLLNSWGDDWGDQGHAWLSYRAFDRQVRGAYVAWDMPTWDPEEREAQLRRELAAALARAGAAEARADSAEARARVAAETRAEEIEARADSAEAAARAASDSIASLVVQLRLDSTSTALALAHALDDFPTEPTYEEYVRVGAPRLVGDRISWFRIHAREDGFVTSLGEEDVKGYLHEIGCSQSLTIGFSDREVIRDERMELGLGHLRDVESSHVQFADDNGPEMNFFFNLAADKCYVLVSEGYGRDDTGPYSLRFGGRMRYRYVTHGQGGWSPWSAWASPARR